eukprot:gnl/TRDRNA2_/TRDRNA2_58826_c0_seq1.p1 gnl/TRDRNA2_/TRDRNA2_58826_c0~~gnl/TRDRNA2_/TRDRNA2_58826_c0_seq1.p1  ORF type:complete len:261 (+),score=48.48 gnl/TRDRNA2_/TRDRNA2_58826_c0_seq1:84-785(+)
MAKFPWGKVAFPFDLMPAIIAFATLLVGAVLAIQGPEGAVEDTLVLKNLHGVVAVSVGYIVMFYSTLGAQVGIKMSGKSDEKASNIALRGMTNTLEQMGPFLLALWLHAIFVNPNTSTSLGWVYVIVRFLYTPAYGFYGQFSLLCEFATMPNYTVIIWFCLALLVKACSDNDLHKWLHEINPVMDFVGALAAAVLCMLIFMGLGTPIAKIIIAGVEWDKEYEASSEEEELAES